MLQQGEGARWGDTEHLLAGIFDVLAAANWQRGGGKGQKPLGLPRPGKQPTTWGKAVPLEEARERLRLRKLGLTA